MKEVYYNVIYKELKNIRNDYSTGFDGTPAALIKPVVTLSSPLTYIINNCIKMGGFPRLWKIAKICPIPKVSSPTVYSDYIPISLLPIISKVFEGVILNQLKESLNQHQVLCSTQSDYRKSHFWVKILHKLHSDIQTWNKGEVTVGVITDYSKPFDAVTYLIIWFGNLSWTFTIHRIAREVGGYFFKSSPPLPPTSQTRAEPFFRTFI